MRHEFPRGLRDAILLAFGMLGLSYQLVTGEQGNGLTAVFASCILGAGTLRLDEWISRRREGEP